MSQLSPNGFAVYLRDSELDGRQAEHRLAEIGITVNRNAVPFDPRPPAVSSGLRLSERTRALAERRPLYPQLS